MNAIQALKKQVQARSIQKDDHSLVNYFTNESIKGKAALNVLAIESRYVPSMDKRDAAEGEGAGCQGFRTRFHLVNGESVGTFSNGAHRFFATVCEILGYESEAIFTKIEITGNMIIEVSRAQLDGDRTTWNFEIIEEGSDVQGMTNALDGPAEVFKLQEGSEA